jgi:hypothetical protein
MDEYTEAQHDRFVAALRAAILLRDLPQFHPLAAEIALMADLPVAQVLALPWVDVLPILERVANTLMVECAIAQAAKEHRPDA